MSERSLYVLAKRIDRLNRDNKRLESALILFLAAVLIIGVIGQARPTHTPQTLRANNSYGEFGPAFRFAGTLNGIC